MMRMVWLAVCRTLMDDGFWNSKHVGDIKWRFASSLSTYALLPCLVLIMGAGKTEKKFVRVGAAVFKSLISLSYPSLH